MKPIEIHEKAFRLLGCVFYGDPFHSAKEWSNENEIGKLWMRLHKLTQKYSILIKSIITDLNVGYELHLEPEEYKITKKYYVMVGMEMNNIEEIPLEMFVKILPKTRYVKFTTTIEEKFKIGAYIYNTWIPEKGYEQAFPFIVQGYDAKRYKGLDDPNSEIDWYIPVKKKYQNKLQK